MRIYTYKYNNWKSEISHRNQMQITQRAGAYLRPVTSFLLKAIKKINLSKSQFDANSR